MNDDQMRSLQQRQELHKLILDRNHREIQPFLHIYKHHEALWKKYTWLDENREQARHRINLLEHETTDLLVNKADPNLAVENFKKKISNVQQHLVRYEMQNRDQRVVTNLSKVIYDQKKLIANQIEELMVAKSELQNAMLQIATLNEELQRKNIQFNDSDS